MPMDEEHGILIGHSLQNEEKKPVYLPPNALEHHTLLVGCLGTGKTTLLEHLTVAAMEGGYGVVVIDCNDDLVPALLKRVPKKRVSDTYWLDGSYQTPGAALNWLDVAVADKDTIVNGFIHAAPQIWREFWSPHLQDALVAGLRTLLAANETLVKQNEPQFTCQDLQALFFREEFRRLLLAEYVRDPEVRLWWVSYFDHLPQDVRLDLSATLLGRWQVFVQSAVVAKSVAQPNMWIPLSRLQLDRAILLVNQRTETLRDLGLGALSSLLLHRVLASAKVPTPREEPLGPPRLVVVMNGMQALPDQETLWRLGEFSRAGVSFILSAQSLCAIPEPGIVPTLFANVENLFIFRTTGQDAQLILPETHAMMHSQSITLLSDHECFLRTRGPHGMPRFDVLETLPPGQGDDAIATEIQKRQEHYTRPCEEVETERRAFYEKWRERGAEYRRQQAHPEDDDEENTDGPDDGEPSPTKCDP